MPLDSKEEEERHSLPIIWKKEKILEFLAPAFECGTSRADFATLAEAKKFRFACYGLARRHGIGREFSYLLEANTDEKDNYIYSVRAEKTPVFVVTRQS